MKSTAPHYLLFSESQSETNEAPGGCWRFVLECVDGAGRIEVADNEPGVTGERLQLLAVVRGLEALEQPSRVTLITASRYVGRGIRNGLAAWRDNDWVWERFGELVPIKNRDLWRRVDRAMKFHHVECRVWQFGSELADDRQTVKTATLVRQPAYAGLAARQKSNLRSTTRGQWENWTRAIGQRLNSFRFGRAYGCA